MARRVSIERTPEDSGDLVGTAEAADILDVERTRIARYMKTGVMPEPVAKLRATQVWLKADVEKLADQRRQAAIERAGRKVMA